MLLKLATLVAGAGAGARRGADLGLALLQNRLALLSLELKEEQVRFVQVLVWAMLGLGLLFIGLILGLLAVIQAVGEEHRLEALAWSGGALLLAGLAALAFSAVRLRRRPAPFAQTISELGKDRAWLSGNGSES